MLTRGRFQAEEEARRLEEAKKIVLVEDASLPAAVQIKIREGKEHRGKRVKISGWVHRLRSQGKALLFIVLRDGTGLVQCVLNDRLVRLFAAFLHLFLMNFAVPDVQCADADAREHRDDLWRAH